MRTLIPSIVVKDTRQNPALRRRLEKGLPVWVVNCSDEQFGTKAVHFITFTDKTGKTRSINFPDTYLPVCLTNEIPASVLLDSADFWVYINRGMLRMIKPEDAEAILNEPDVGEETERLRLRSQGSRSNRGDQLRKTAGVLPSGQTRFDASHPDDKGRDADRAEDDIPRISNRVMAICGRVESGSLRPRQAKAELRNMTLGREDYGYIMGNARYMDPETRQTDDLLAEWAMEQLQKIGLAAATRRGGAQVDPVREILGMTSKKGKKGKKGKKAA